jgi:ATP-binding cassette, subfamily C (CFTR/MRP), member 1
VLRYYVHARTEKQSFVLILYWLLTTLALAVQLRTTVLQGADMDSQTALGPLLPLLAAQVGAACVVLLAASVRWRTRGHGADHAYRSVDEDPPRRVSPEGAANFFSTLTFWWLTPLMVLGYRKPLEMDDLWELDPDEAVDRLAGAFAHAWAQQQARPRPSLLRALAAAFGRPMLFAAPFKLLQDLLAFVQPLLLRQLLLFVASYDPTGSGSSSGPSVPTPLYWGYLIAVSMFMTAVTQTLLLHQYFHRCFMTGMRVRAAMVTSVYRKALRLSNDARQQSTVGEIVNHMSIDAQKLMDLMTYLHILWSGPLQIARTCP